MTVFFAFFGDCDIIFQLCFVHCFLHCLCNNIVYIYVCVCLCVCFNGAFLFALETYLSLSHCCCYCCTGLNSDGMHINFHNRRNMYIHFSRLHKHISRILLPDRYSIANNTTTFRIISSSYSTKRFRISCQRKFATCLASNPNLCTQTSR